MQIARYPSPSTSAVRSKLSAQTLSCESKQLLQDLLSFCVDCTKCFKHHRTKEIVSAFEAHVVLAMLLCSSIPLAGLLLAHISSSKRASDCDIDCKTFALGPSLDRDITRSATCGVAKNAFLLKHWRQHAVS